MLYNTIISGLTFNYHLKEAVEVLFETFEKRKVLNHEVYFNILRNLYKKINSRYAMKSDLSQEEYEEIIRKIHENLDSLKIKLDETLLQQIQESGMEEFNMDRRSSDQYTRKRGNSNASYQHIQRRTIY